MAKGNLLGTCPYCGSLYYMEEDNDRGHCGRVDCSKKAGDYKVVETKLAAGGKIVEFTTNGKGNKVKEEKQPKEKVILKSPIEIEKARKANGKRTAKSKSKKANARRVSKK